MEASHSLEPFVTAALATTPLDAAGRSLHAWDEGGDAATVQARLERILAGHQRASALPLAALRQGGDGPPSPGDLLVLPDARGQPTAVIEVIEARVLPFDRVDEHFAADHGEGDLSLRSWRETHRDAFERQAIEHGDTDPDLPLVAIRFRLVYPRLLGA